jgi:hypothetical protein
LRFDFFFGVVLRYACVVHLFCVLRSWFRPIHHRKFELSEKRKMNRCLQISTVFFLFFPQLWIALNALYILRCFATFWWYCCGKFYVLQNGDSNLISRLMLVGQWATIFVLFCVIIFFFFLSSVCCCCYFCCCCRFGYYYPSLLYITSPQML